MRVPVEKLRAFMQESAEALPMDHSYAQVMVDNLITASLWGIDSHGVNRYPVYMNRLHKNSVNRTPNITIKHTFPAAISVDGDNGLGSVIMLRALEESMKAADTYGISVAAIKSGNHVGAVGYYCDMAARKGYVTVMFAVAPANMPPYGGMETYFGTNPISIGIPCPDGQHIIVDIATSVAAKGKVRNAARKGEPIPEGWAIDKDGNPTTDAQAAIDGLMLPFAAHKGSALALVVECFAGVMSGSAFGKDIIMQWGDDPRPADVGHFFITFKPESFMPIEDYNARILRFCSELRAIKPAKGFEKVILPGEAERIAAKAVIEDGIEIDDTLAKQFEEIAELVGRKVPWGH